MEARIEKAARGDRDAMAQVVAEHYAAVYRFCARRIGGELAKDAAQETFLTAQRTLKRYDGRSTVLTFLLGIAHNHCRNMARKNRMEISYEEVWEKPDGANAAQTVVDRETLRGALLGLSQEHREVIVMHELEGLRYEEIATVLRVPLGTVKSRLHNAFIALRTKLIPLEEVSA
jgi:RNA polymerase sigma-70 factor (ECF subfamily)